MELSSKNVLKLSVIIYGNILVVSIVFLTDLISFKQIIIKKEFDVIKKNTSNVENGLRRPQTRIDELSFPHQNISNNSCVYCIDASKYKVLIEPKHVCRNIDILMLITSSHRKDGMNRRMAIRKTWSNSSETNMKLGHIFILGKY